ncbi:hypothetical protein Dimus_006039, partial [Dionaea muscipula]
PLDDKEGEEPVKTDFYEETFLNLCQLKREQEPIREGIIRRKLNEETNEEKNPEENFKWEQVEEEAEVQGEPRKKRAVVEFSGSGDKSYDAKKGETTVD